MLQAWLCDCELGAERQTDDINPGSSMVPGHCFPFNCMGRMIFTSNLEIDSGTQRRCQPEWPGLEPPHNLKQLSCWSASDASKPR